MPTSVVFAGLGILDHLVTWISTNARPAPPVRMEELATIQKAVLHAHAQWDTLEMRVTWTLTNA